MSSFSGTTNGQTDAGLQLAPVGNDGPDHALLSKTFSNTLANLQGFFDQCEENFNTRYALWSGQSADGKKHSREGSKIDPTPWDGASDLQVFLTAEAILKTVAMLSMAFRRAGISATPVEGSDIKRAKTVANFMRWMGQTQIPEVAREVKLLANFIQEQGIGAMGTFWEETQEKILTTVTLEQLQAQSPEADLTTALYSTEGEDQLVEIFVGLYECSRAKAKKMLSEYALCVPAIYSLGGIEADESCAIERLETRAKLRHGPVSTANHWTGFRVPGRARGFDSPGRWRCMEETHASGMADNFAWVAPPILNATTRVAVIANARTRKLMVRGWEKDGPATEVFTL